MRIAFFVTLFPALSETFILNQITGLVERGHDVWVFAQRPGEMAPLHPDMVRHRLLDRTIYPPRMPGNTLLRFAHAILLFLRHVWQSPTLILRSLNVVKHGKAARSLKLFYLTIPWLGKEDFFDIIHCQFGPNGNLAVQLRDIGATRAKIVTTFHGADIRQGLREGAQVYAPLRRGGDCIFSISAYNRRHLEQFGFDPLKIKHHSVGIDLGKFAFREVTRTGPRDANRPIRILTVARLVEAKGVEYGIRGIGALLKNRPGLELDYRIVGDGPLHTSLKDLVLELGLAKVVTFLGAHDQTQVIQHMRESHLYLLPSVAEALPVVLMEAQAVGLPILCTDVGSVADLVANGESGFVVPPRDVDALAAGLSRLIECRESWPQMGRAGRAHVERHYDIEQLNNRLVEIYRELLERKESRM